MPTVLEPSNTIVKAATAQRGSDGERGMKRGSRRLHLVLVALVLVAPAWLGATTAAAQTTLDAYTRAKTALEASIAATPSDSVASLDALRQAQQAFEPLGEALGTSLNQGLQVTFDRAEQAIINASRADLRVQGAVLFGGFQRSLYEAALSAAQDGNVAQARRLLGVLGRDLELTPAQVPIPKAGVDPTRALQLSFERRLAQRSLQQLAALRSLPQEAATRDARYEVLAGLYSHIFLVQDSPRLPASTQVTVLDAIQALIAGLPIEPSLATLQAQLQRFRQAATTAQQRLQPTVETAQPPAAAPDRPAGQAATPDTENAAAAEPAETTGPGLEAAREATATAPSSVQTPAPSAPETPPDEEPRQPAAPPSRSAEPPTAEPPADTLFGVLTEPVRAYLLIAAGLLALVGIVLLVARAGTSPALRSATILLLLPVLSEGLIALGETLAPLLGVPALALGSQYSLFVSPLMQGVWTLLALIAGLAVLFTRRAATAEAGGVEPSSDAKPATLPQRAPLSSSGTFNWDEDF